MDDHYDSRPDRLLVLHLCLRCGAEVGVRRIHDEWHDRHEQLRARMEGGEQRE